MRVPSFTVVMLLTLVPLGVAAEVTRFRSLAQGGVGVPVLVNGSGPFVFLVDTGSKHSSVSDRMASRLRLPIVAKAEVSTPAGDDLRGVAHVSRLAIGPIAATNLLASIVPVAALDREGTIDGIIGQDVLSALRFTIDYRRNEIRWLGDGESEAGGSVVNLTKVGGRFLLDLPVGKTTLRLVPDSGAGGVVLFNPTDRVVSTPTGAMAELWAGVLRQSVEVVTLRELRIGRVRLTDVPAFVLRNKRPTESSGDGLLPLHLFERVTFDGPASRLIVG